MTKDKSSSHWRFGGIFFWLSTELFLPNEGIWYNLDLYIGQTFCSIFHPSLNMLKFVCLFSGAHPGQGVPFVPPAFADHVWFARGSASVGRAYKGVNTSICPFRGSCCSDFQSKYCDIPQPTVPTVAICSVFRSHFIRRMHPGTSAKPFCFFLVIKYLTFNVQDKK